jgi:hypothetical protein
MPDFEWRGSVEVSGGACGSTKSESKHVLVLEGSMPGTSPANYRAQLQPSEPELETTTLNPCT